MAQFIESHFGNMGARVRVAVATELRGGRRWNGGRIGNRTPQAIRVDILRDGKGEYFEIAHRSDVDISVIDVRPSDRHLLLMAREGNSSEPKSKFLCGRDERSWFVAAIPEKASVSTVQDAKDALKPEAVWESIRAHKLPLNNRDRRRTAAFIRQGEWFFIPRPQLRVDMKNVLTNEPIRRGAGKPHMCQFMHRDGGVQVWVCAQHPNGLTAQEYANLDPVQRKAERWRTMVRDAHVYVKGSIRHADHKTVWLPGWHEVVMNTETQARAMRQVAFLD
jgi:hypothetical protein